MDPELLALLERLRAQRSSTATRTPPLEERSTLDDVGVGALQRILQGGVEGLGVLRRGILNQRGLPATPASRTAGRIVDRASEAGRFIVENKLVPTSLQEAIDAAGAMTSLDREQLRETPGTLIPELLVALMPGPGEIQAGRDVAMDVRAGDVGWGTALAGIGMIPAVGPLVRGVVRGGRALRGAGRTARGAGDISGVGREARKASRAVGSGGGEEIIELAAIRTPAGEEFFGQTHFDAIRNAIDSGKLPKGFLTDPTAEARLTAAGADFNLFRTNRGRLVGRGETTSIADAASQFKSQKTRDIVVAGDAEAHASDIDIRGQPALEKTARQLRSLKETGFADEIPGGGVNIRPGEGGLDTVSAIKRAQNIVGKEQFEQMARTDVAARGGTDVAAMSGTEDTARRIVRERDALTAGVMKRHAKGGGSTTHARTGVEPTEGYGVSTFKDREFTVDNMTQTDLDNYINQNSDLLDQDDVFLGTWRDKANNRDVIDVSAVIDDRDVALRVARAADQDAIWDFANQKEIRVPIVGPFGTQSMSTAVRGTKRARNLQRFLGESQVTQPVFHGSIAEFDEFSRTSDLGFHFGTKKQAEGLLSGMEGSSMFEAASRAGKEGKVGAFHIRAENPIRLPDLGSWLPSMTATELSHNAAIQNTVFARIARDGLKPSDFLPNKHKNNPGVFRTEITQKYLIDNVISPIKRANPYSTNVRLQNKALVEIMQDSGFDSVVYKNRAEGISQTANELQYNLVGGIDDVPDVMFDDSYIIFKPEQVKAVKGVGTFDPTDPRFMYGAALGVGAGAQRKRRER